MPRGEVLERQPLLFPVGEFGPPDGPKGPVVACPGEFQDGGDWEFRFAMAGLAYLLVKAYLASHEVGVGWDVAGR